MRKYWPQLFAVVFCAVVLASTTGAQAPPPVPLPRLDFFDRMARVLEAFLNSGGIILAGSALAIPLRILPKVKNIVIPLLLGVGNFIGIFHSVIVKFTEAATGVAYVRDTNALAYAGWSLGGLGGFVMGVVSVGLSGAFTAAQRMIYEKGIRKWFPNIADPKPKPVAIVGIGN